MSWKRREPSTLGSSLAASTTPPSRMTLSAMIRLPGRASCERPGEVVRSVVLVGVDEDQIERLTALGGELRERVERRSDAQLDDVGEAGIGDVRARDLGVGGIGLERHERVPRARARAPARSCCSRRGCPARGSCAPRWCARADSGACPAVARRRSSEGRPRRWPRSPDPARGRPARASRRGSGRPRSTAPCSSIPLADGAGAVRPAHGVCALARLKSSENSRCWAAAGNGRRTPVLNSVTVAGPCTKPSISK